MSFTQRKRPLAGGLDTYTKLHGAKYTASPSRPLPQNWRDRLPDPASYYRQHVENLGKANATGWAQGRCPFHNDRNASLSVHVADARGGWRCFASCGGGDLVGFHMRITGKPFADAVRDLIGMRGAQ
ncbi:MAG: CHC2 zinc finger domain-containing protein [Rudaea sp.]